MAMVAPRCGPVQSRARVRWRAPGPPTRGWSADRPSDEGRPRRL